MEIYKYTSPPPRAATSARWKEGLQHSAKTKAFKKGGIFLGEFDNNTVDGRNPANHLRLVVYPIIYKVLYIPGGAGFQPSTVVPGKTSCQYYI